jgi:uncharacterized membrane protein
MLLLYVLARICQLYADKLSILTIVMLHVVPPAVFALLHGSMLYRLKGILVFTTFCLGFGALFESISLRTGFPFGHYYFTDVMGPKVVNVPILLVLAYLGIGYLSWVLALLILGYVDKPLVGLRVIVLPLLASFIMVAWDVSMEPDWATLDRAWIWRSGGAYFGVPLSNFFGWYLTAYLFYQSFALYCSAKPAPSTPLSRSYWRTAVLFYGICAAGNLLIIRLPMAPPVVTDPSGRQWMTMSILGACMLMSLFVMGPIALLAWLRLKEREFELL